MALVRKEDNLGDGQAKLSTTTREARARDKRRATLRQALREISHDEPVASSARRATQRKHGFLLAPLSDSADRCWHAKANLRPDSIFPPSRLASFPGPSLAGLASTDQIRCWFSPLGFVFSVMLPAKLAIGFDSRSAPEARLSVRGSEMLAACTEKA